MDSCAQLALTPFRSGASPEAADAGLREAVAAHSRAEHHVVLWFAEIQRRRLHRPLGYGSMYIYATQALGFSESRACQFLRIADALSKHAALRTALASGRLRWTKAREIIDIVTHETLAHWIERACALSRRALAAEVARSRAAARGEARRAQATLPATEARKPKTTLAALGVRPAAMGAGPGAGTGGEGARPGAPGGGAGAPGDGAGAPGGVPMSHTGAANGARSQADTSPGEPAGIFTTDTEVDPPPPVPRTISLRLDPMDYATFDALIAELRKAGARGSREALVLEGLEAALGMRLRRAADARRLRKAERNAARKADRNAARNTDRSAARNGTRDATRRRSPGDTEAEAGSSPTPQEKLYATPFVAMRSPFQVHVQLCAACGDASLPTSRGDVSLSYEEVIAILEDADIIGPDFRRRATIPPRMRRAIYARDGFTCQAPGCGRCQGLSVHHVVPVSADGENSVANGITVCWMCHLALHAKTARGRELRRWRATIGKKLATKPIARGTGGRPGDAPRAGSDVGRCGSGDGGGLVREESSDAYAALTAWRAPGAAESGKEFTVPGYGRPRVGTRAARDPILTADH